jgi:hypothetical protein
MKANDECGMQNAELGTTRLFRLDTEFAYPSLVSPDVPIHHSLFAFIPHPSSLILGY